MTPTGAVHRLMSHVFAHRRPIRIGPHPTQETKPPMKSFLSRTIAAAVMLAIAVALIGAAAPSKVLEPNKVVILSTTDVKGKNEPCG